MNLNRYFCLWNVVNVKKQKEQMLYELTAAVSLSLMPIWAWHLNLTSYTHLQWISGVWIVNAERTSRSIVVKL